MSTASNERGLSLRSPGRFLAARTAGRAVASNSPTAATTRALTDRVVDAWIGARAYQLHTWATVTRLADGGELGAESSVGKLFWSELDVALHETALDLLGARGELAATGWPATCSRCPARSTRHQRDPAQRRRRAAAGAAAMRFALAAGAARLRREPARVALRRRRPCVVRAGRSATSRPVASCGRGSPRRGDRACPRARRRLRGDPGRSRRRVRGARPGRGARARSSSRSPCCPRCCGTDHAAS